MKKAILLLALILLVQLSFAQTKLNFSYDLSNDPAPYKHYWKSTGYSPAWMTINEDYRLYLNMLKGTKGQAVEFIRPHYLLTHVEIKNIGEPNQSYDWTELDEILDLLTEAKLKLIFEMMIGRHPYFDDWYDRTKLDAWNRLCTDLIVHLQDRYGKETVRSWYFEGTNEPDIRHFWSYGPLEYMYYFDATAAGIKKADPEIRFGGPGSALGLNTLFETFIQHVYDDFNFYTQDTGVMVDFITWHRKFDPHNMITMEQELNSFMLKKKFRSNKKLVNLPIGNDEADPLAGWGKEYWWRPTPWYASFVVQCTDLHNQMFIDSLQRDYFVLSNDNAFMGDWYRRTHVARFIPGDNSIMQKRSSQRGGAWKEGDDTRTETKAFYLIKKPDLTVMSLLAMQGNERFNALEATQDSTGGAIVSKNEAGEYFIVTYNKPEIEVNWRNQGRVASENEAKRYRSQAKSIQVSLEGIPEGDYQIIQYKIDEEHGNPYKVWQDMGSPEDPSIEQIKKIQTKEDPTMTLSKPMKINGQYSFVDTYPTSGVTLTYLARNPNTKPQAVSELEYHSYQGLNNELMVMLNWDHPRDLHIKSYDVFYSPKKGGKYSKVNGYNVFEPSFLHFNGKKGFYKIQAVDHWNRKSAYSSTIEVK
ncbi:MAG: hypothetical protein AAFO07_04320 [Bacteroidota bacterium]